jgi:hypothetical protein
MPSRSAGTKTMVEHGSGSGAMTTARRGPAGGCAGGGEARVRGAAHWLRLAAAPTFAIMALLTGIHGDGMPDVLCSAAGNGLPLSGMLLMYLLMTAFHLGPWLKLISPRP